MKLAYNDQHHSYWLDGQRCKGVSTLAKTLESTFALEQWQMRMVAIGMAKSPALVEAVAVHFDDKDRMKELVEKAKEAAGSFVAQDRGSTVHRITERHDLGMELIDTQTNIAVRTAWNDALDRAGLEVVPEYVERCIVYPEQKIAGRFDRLMRRRSDRRLVIVDTKGGAKALQYPHPIAIQLAGYANAPLLAGVMTPDGKNGSVATTEFIDLSTLDLDREVGYVIHIPSNDRAKVAEFDIAAGWRAFRDLVLPILEWRSRDDLCRPVGPDLLEQLEGSLGTAAGSALGEVAPAAVPQQEEPCASSEAPSAGNGATSAGDGTQTQTTGSMNPPTTTSATLKTRLRQIQTEQPDLARIIIKAWPIRRTLAEAWDDAETAVIECLLWGPEGLDIEGPRVDPAELERIGNLFARLDDAQQARVRQWVVEAEHTPGGHGLNLGAGWHTTRRIALAEACLLLVGASPLGLAMGRLIDEATGERFRTRTEALTIGDGLALMNWREAQHLLALTRLHLNLDATIEETS